MKYVVIKAFGKEKDLAANCASITFKKAILEWSLTISNHLLLKSPATNFEIFVSFKRPASCQEVPCHYNVVTKIQSVSICIREKW